MTIEVSAPGAAKARVTPSLAGPLARLYERVPLGMRLGLEPMRAACTNADNPERAFRSVHVAGTNGKGSTCAMVESMVRAGARSALNAPAHGGRHALPGKIGLYTSPHLCRFAERIRIDGEPLADDELADVLARALDLGPELSFFETATLAAFLAFRDHKVDLAVLEVGIGGRLDATNVIPPPRICAITRVALDHCDRLGMSLEEIAREKAGIAKANVPMVLGPMSPEVRAAALEVALAAGALPIVMGDDPDAVARDAIAMGLRGAYQHDNARIASRIARELGIADAERRQGLASTRWPGRFEHVEVEDGPLRGAWLLDGAHNPDGARSLVHSLEAEQAAGAEPPSAVVFGVLADKDWASMLDALAGLPCPRIYVAPRGRTAIDPARLAAHSAGRVAATIPEALAQARRDRDGSGPIVVCGSLSLVGEARAQLLGLPEDPPVAL